MLEIARPTSQLELLKKAKIILSFLSKNQDAELKKKFHKQFLEILPNLNLFLQETLLHKDDDQSRELKIDIVKLIKQQLRKADSISISSDENSQKQLTKFVHLISKSTAKQNQFQTDLANYFKQKFINIDSVLIEKEGIVFKKNQDGNYSKEPAGTADVVIKIINKKGELISQYCVECDGSSHTDKEKDDLRDAYLINNSNGFLCLKHGNIDFADYLSQNQNEAQKINNLAKEINQNEVVVQEKTLLKEQIRAQKPIQAGPRNPFKLLYGCDDEEKMPTTDASTSSQGEMPINTRKKPRFIKQKNDAGDLALEEAGKIAEAEQKLIDLFYRNIEEEQWDVFLDETFKICRQKSRSNLDSYLLKIAKTYVAELLKTKYKHKCFLSSDFFAALGAFDMRPDEILYIANNLLLQNKKFIENTEEFDTLIKTAFTSRATVLDCEDARFQMCCLTCCHNNYLYLFQYLQKHHEKFSEKIDLMSCLKVCSYGNSYEIAKLLLLKLSQKETESLGIAAETKSWCIDAAFKGSLEMVKVLLGCGVDVNSVNEKSYTALMLAAKNGHTEVARLLLERRANVDLQDEDGITALMLAAQNGHTEVVELLLNKEANVNSKLKTTGQTALMLAAQEGHTKVVELLLNKEANVNLQLKTGQTALMLAAQEGHTKVVELLLNKEANVNLQLKKGETALMLAAQVGHTEVVRLLLERRANVDLQDEDGITALMLVACSGNTKVVELLLNKEANVNLQLKTGQTALMLAAKNGHTEVVELLLNKGADIDPKLKTGETALMLAVKNGHTEVAELLKKLSTPSNNPNGPRISGTSR